MTEMAQMTIESAAAHLLDHATPAYAPIISAHIPGQPGLVRTVRVGIEVEDGVWSWLLPHGGTAAWRDVLLERGRQIQQKGYTPEHDDAHVYAEISRGAVSKVIMAVSGFAPEDNAQVWQKGAEAFWPFEGDAPTGEEEYREQIVQAAAMLVAELERLDRASAEGQP